MIWTPGQLNRRAELYNQLGSMITAGVPLIQALEMSGKNAALRGSRWHILTLVDHLRHGLTFSDAMLRAQGWLSEFDMALLTAGEQSGKLDFSFKALGQYYATRAMIFRETISNLAVATLNLNVFLLIFPLFLFIHFGMGILNNDFHQCVPFILEKVAAFGLIWGSVIFFIFACQGKRGERWRAILEHGNQAVPLLRTALKYLVLFRFTTALGALVNSGISIVKGLPMAAAASGSAHLKRKSGDWPRDFEAGATPSELIRGEPYFPEMFANLYYTGEVSGSLDDALGRLQTYYREEGFRRLLMFMRIFSRVIYFAIAIMIAYNVVEFYLHYYASAFTSF
ncbi:MAG: type II secretion system F family protein [Limisphaerales bacterium]